MPGRFKSTSEFMSDRRGYRVANVQSDLMGQHERTPWGLYLEVASLRN